MQATTARRKIKGAGEIRGSAPAAIVWAAVLVCPSERNLWERFCDTLDLPAELRSRGNWASDADRGDAYVALGKREVIQAKIASRTRDEWVAVIASADLPLAPVLDWREAMVSGHAAAYGVMTQYEHKGKTVCVPTTPFSITAATELGEGGYERLAEAHRAKADVHRRATHLGEHNEALFRESRMKP